jgi:hypothetical protein
VTEIVGTAEHYAEFVRLCRSRIEALGLTFDSVDALSGFGVGSRYTAILLSGGKAMSVFSFFTLDAAICARRDPACRIKEAHRLDRDAAQGCEVSAASQWRRRKIHKSHRFLSANWAQRGPCVEYGAKAPEGGCAPRDHDPLARGRLRSIVVLAGFEQSRIAPAVEAIFAKQDSGTL